MVEEGLESQVDPLPEDVELTVLLLLILDLFLKMEPILPTAR